MGAWGIGIFEDDTALDCFDELIESDPNEYMDKAFANASSAKYIEYDLCCAVLVSGAIMDSLLNNTVHDVDEVVDWLTNNKQLQITVPKNKAINALKKVISNESELNELWAENNEEYPNWKSNIEAMIKRLS